MKNQLRPDLRPGDTVVVVSGDKYVGERAMFDGRPIGGDEDQVVVWMELPGDVDNWRGTQVFRYHELERVETEWRDLKKAISKTFGAIRALAFRKGEKFYCWIDEVLGDA